MKELEKTKRISISATLFLLVVVISLLTFKKPEFVFSHKADKVLEYTASNSHVISLADYTVLDKTSFVLLDVRNSYDFAKGHMDQAINIPTNQLLDKKKLLELSPEPGSQHLIIYGKNPEQANAALFLLYQLGQENSNVLSITTRYDDKQFHMQPVQVGKASLDYASDMKKAQIQPVKKIQPKKVIRPKKTKVIPKPKKKKKMPEGGC
ncbi:rhodanese-like domain-containing protein [Lutimonas sp.]|uniref:rhodanese-like domain-containing protein n=1 Tax=Lutimonas sp. TaxID=1872403 RepID=UPI003D9BF70C